MKKNRRRVFVLSAVLLMVLCLCDVKDVRAETSVNRYDQTVTVTKPSKIKKLDMKVQNYCVLHCGEKMQLTVGGKKATNWKSSDPEIVKVNSNGVVTACDHGDNEYWGTPYAYVTCKQNGVTYKCLVTDAEIGLSAGSFFIKMRENNSMKLFQT